MNPNLFIWTSDWHVVSNDTEHGGTNETYPTRGAALTSYIASLEPAGVIDTGDCKDHYGEDSGDELDRYLETVAGMPWATVNPGVNALHPILPGNHDEEYDYIEPGEASVFDLFDDRLWGPPYHWTCDWGAPRVRFIGVHSYIQHPGDSYRGYFSIDAAEVEWLASELAALPAGWQAIVCSHTSIYPPFGYQIHADLGGADLTALLAANRTKVCAYLSGHRHFNMASAYVDGILHISGPGVAYTLGNGDGGWVPIDYEPMARTLTFRFLTGANWRNTYPPRPGYTPIEVQLPPLEVPPPPPTDLELALVELKLTTVGYKNKYWTVPPVGSHWSNALDHLEVS